MSMTQPQPASMAENLLAQFKQEMVATRTTLERVPFEKAEWAPHEKSMTLGHLAGHISEMPGWGAAVITTEEYDMNPVDGEGYQAAEPKSLDDILTAFDAGVAAAEGALAGASDEDLAVHWSLKSGGEEVMGAPRGAFFRDVITSHLIHHRAQLGVYLRLLDIPVPGPYGPSADEKEE